VADVISCSWTGPQHAGVVAAINDTIQGRGTKGSVLVGAVGNHGWTNTIGFPARHRRAIAVGACGPADQVTQYSNVGAAIDVVAPSSHGNVGKVYSTDVSQPNWGFNTGQPDDPDGWFSNAFGKTSAAAATTAGVAALCLSANPNLTAAEVRTVLQVTADKVGGDQVGYDAEGHSRKFGHGCINAAKAVALATQMIGPPVQVPAPA
jgi:subtilisin family serine protease